MAVCIGDGKWRHGLLGTHESGPKRGQFVIVEEVCPYRSKVLLGFPEWPEFFYCAKRFIKVTPDAELIEAERNARVPA